MAALEIGEVRMNISPTICLVVEFIDLKIQSHCLFHFDALFNSLDLKNLGFEFPEKRSKFVGATAI